MGVNNQGYVGPLMLQSRLDAGLTVQPAPANSNITLWASGAKTATWTTPVQFNNGWSGVQIAVNVTAISGLGIKPQINGVDPTSGQSWAILTASAAITATGLYIYSVNPSNFTSGIGAQNCIYRLPPQWSVTITHLDSNSDTYSVGVGLFV